MHTNDRREPAFIGIGAPHAGLGQIANWLAEHVDVVDHVPACNFFNSAVYEKKGLSWYEDKLGSLVKSPNQKIGECTAGYMTDPSVAPRIAKHYPDTKLFMVVRHPLHRALAEYEAHVHIDAHAARMSAAEYLARNESLQRYSRYADHLESYFSYYSPVGLNILIYEEIAASPLETTQNLYDFLGLDNKFVPKSLKQFAPPPEPPKNPGMIKRGIMKSKTMYKKLTERPVGPVFPSDPQTDTWLTEDEKKMFLQSFIGPTERLSQFMGRDMVAYWNLDDRA